MALVRYTLYRIGLFAGALVVLWLCGIGGWLAVLWALVLAFLLSYLLLAGPRRRANAALAARAEARAARRAARPHRPAAPTDENVEDALTSPDAPTSSDGHDVDPAGTAEPGDDGGVVPVEESGVDASPEWTGLPGSGLPEQDPAEPDQPRTKPRKNSAL